MAHDLRGLTRAWFQTVWNDRDPSAIPRYASPEVVCYGLDETGKPWKGFEQFKKFHRGFLSAFPDLKIEVEDILVDGDKTAARLQFSGRHDGDGIGVPPTGNPFVATAIVIMRWNEGKIVEVWNEFDAAGMIRQLQTPAAKLRVS